MARSSAGSSATRTNFIEQIGLVLEEDGLPRIGGQIFAYLMISEDDRSLEDITAELKISKASASINTRLLEQRGVIEKTQRCGDRRDYYRMVSDVFARTMEQRLNRWKRFSTIVRQTLTDKKLAPPARDRLTEFQDASEQMQELITKALKHRSRGKH
jgi:DNA-binding transcriptional regulator GbsR (MarR family)